MLQSQNFSIIQSSFQKNNSGLAISIYFYETLYAGIVLDAVSFPDFAKWGTAHSGTYVFCW